MSTGFDPQRLWDERITALKHDQQRIEQIVSGITVVGRPQLRESMQWHLDLFREEFNRQVKALSNLPIDERWREYGDLSRFCRQACESQLELISGVALTAGLRYAAKNDAPFDGGFCARAEAWLNHHRTLLGLPTPLAVIPGREPLFDARLNLVRLPFLDWDWWRLTLLGKAIGLLAVEEDPARRIQIGLDDLQYSGASGLPSKDRLPYLRELFADFSAAAALGPAYAIPVFVLELDYTRTVSIDRAAVILSALRTFPAFVDIAGRLETLACEVLDSLGESGKNALTAGQTRLDSILSEFPRLLYLPELAQKDARENWQQAKAWANALTSGRNPSPPVPKDLTTALTGVLGGFWLHRINHPEKAEAIHVELLGLIEGEKKTVSSFTSNSSNAPDLVAQARLEMAKKRALRLRALLDDPKVQGGYRTLAMRFYRLLSMELKARSEAEAQLEAQDYPAFWKAMAKLETVFQPHEQEAIEFLGGALVRQARLDCEPSQLTCYEQSGPPICGLADHLLADLVLRTGVDWTSRVIPGGDPFVATTTGVVRARFPDWSLWELPLMAHEFGHLVVLDLPQINNWLYQEGSRLYLAANNPANQSKEERIAGQMRCKNQLEEIFCDIFAVYTMGPSFALSVFYRHLSPAEAFLERGNHPTQAERFAAILAALRCLDAGEKKPAFEGVRAELEQNWQRLLDTVEPERPAGFAARLEQAADWGAKAFDRIDGLFRLGARYSPASWRMAQKAESLLLEILPFDFQGLDQRRREMGCEAFTMPDLLNALWWARSSPNIRSFVLDRLTASGFEVVRSIGMNEEV